MLEVEVKLKINLKKVENKLKNLGFKLESVVYEKDTYFNSEIINLYKEDKALRIREHKELAEDINNSNPHFTLNFKGPKIDDSTMTRSETEFEIPSYTAGETLIKGLGFTEAGNVEKIRSYFKKENINCCLDTVTNLGEFMEIEILTNDSGYDLAIKKIDDLLKMLGYTRADTTRKSYLSMLGFIPVSSDKNQLLSNSRTP